MMMIRIKYQLRAESTPRSMELAPEQYYGPPEAGQTTGRIPRFHHAYQYTEHSADDLKWTILEGGPIEGSVIRTQFLDGRRFMMRIEWTPTATRRSSTQPPSAMGAS
jgi:hypothetical protein